MAIYLLYRQTAQDETSVAYEILTTPDDPEPVQIRISTAADAPLPTITGPKVAANKAIRKIAHRRATEGNWPKGGLIQS